MRTPTPPTSPCSRSVLIRIAVWAIVSASGAVVLAQTTHVRAPQAPAAAATSWRVPRTPWGDPDLQGVYTNSNEYATPLERPEQYAGRRMDDLTPEEIADVRKRARQQALDGLANGQVRGPDEWWLQLLDLSKRSQPWLVIDPPDGRIPPMTAEARARGAGPARTSFAGGPFDKPEDLGLLERCITRGVPGSMIPVMYGNNYLFVQTPDSIAITYEIVHEARVIPIDRGSPRPHVGEGVQMYMGDPRGHWEGDTLVVETTNFNRQSAYRGGNPATLRVVERFHRVAADRMSWTATIDDPKTWTRPWTISIPLSADETPYTYPFECHEGNYGLANVLRAARAAEKNGR